MAYAHSKSVTLSADNGVNLNHVRPEVLEGLVKHRFRSMLCSIDGASQETYGIYRRRGSFDRVIENIRAINRYKEEQGSRYPLLGWQFIVFGHNQHEIHAARKLAAELGMSFVLKLSWDESFSPVHRPEELKGQLRIRSISREEFRREHGRDYMQPLCEQLWSAPQINWDGKVLGCCRNFWGDFGGNAFRDGLSGSINNEKITYARAMLRGQSEARPDIPCNTCDIYMHRRTMKQWVTTISPDEC